MLCKLKTVFIRCGHAGELPQISAFVSELVWLLSTTNLHVANPGSHMVVLWVYCVLVCRIFEQGMFGNTFLLSSPKFHGKFLTVGARKVANRFVEQYVIIC